MKLYGIESYIAVPLYRLDGEIFGTLCALDPEPSDVSTDDVELFELFSNLIAHELDAEEKARERQRELENAVAESESQRRLMSILGHDLKNPLSTIIMAATLQKRNVLSAEQNVEMSGKILKTAQRMGRLVNDLLDTTQGLGGREISINPQESELGSICLQIIEEFNISHPQVKIDFYCEENCFGKWDEQRIGQVLANLLSNAISYGKKGIPIKVSLTEDCNRVLIQVNNRGEIISEEEQKNLFTPFWRGSKKNETNAAGLGLGLYIVKQIVEAHNGSITVESNREFGTTFVVSLNK